MRFEYWKNFWGKWNYRLVSSGNNEILMQSTQGHSNKQDMLAIIEKIKDRLGTQVRVSVVDITKYRAK